ncbi:MAG: stage 0 sporulation family protein [Candidatus Eisenbacteria bacterium]
MGSEDRAAAGTGSRAAGNGPAAGNSPASSSGGAGSPAAASGGAGSGTSPRLVQVRFKGHRYERCLLPDSLDPDPGAYLIVEADRGIDIGLLCHTVAEGAASEDRREPRRVLREAGPEEIRHLETIRSEDEEALRICRERAQALDLPMRFLDAEYQFDGNRVTFYFTAEGRIDFRALVRDLAKIFRTRIELRQIPQREAARRLGGLGPCGRPLCCTRLSGAFEPVTLKMAKRQNLALAPARISGMCGRLLCCLAFKDDGEGEGEGESEEGGNASVGVARGAHTPERDGPTPERGGCGAGGCCRSAGRAARAPGERAASRSEGFEA